MKTTTALFKVERNRRFRVAIATALVGLFAVSGAVVGLSSMAAASRGRVTPLATTVFGGGSDPSRTESAVALVSFRTDAASRHLVAWIAVDDFHCKSDAIALFTLPSVAIAPGGKFSSSGTFTDAAAHGATGNYKLTGTFTANYLVTGTIATLVGTCAMGTHTYWAADPGFAGGSGVRRPGAMYVGYTSERSLRVNVQLPFTLRLSTPGKPSTGKAVAGAAAYPNLVQGTSQAICTLLDEFVNVWFDHAFVNSFTDHETLKGAASPTETAVTYTTWTGHFSSHSVNGTWSTDGVAENSSTHANVGQCNSGPLTWRAIAVP